MIPVGKRIVVSGLTKSFGTITAVDNLSFTVEPGSVTGFLGPNGAGKDPDVGFELRRLREALPRRTGGARLSGVEATQP